MKKVLLVLLTISFLWVDAQIITPAPSPLCKIEQKVGLGTINIEYSRPSMKNRVIFGDLVPYGKLWRTGANKSTSITFSENVTIEGKSIPKGSYSIFTIPGEKSWDIIFYSEVNISGTPEKYDNAKEVAKISAVPELLTTSVESFTIDLNNIKPNGATLYIMWENTAVGVNITTEVESTVMKNIDKVIAGPSANDYYQAARFYFDNGKDLSKALEWIQKSTSMDPRYWTVHVEALILAKSGKVQDAIKTAEKSRMMAEQAGSDDYVSLNNKAIAEWSRK